MRHNIATWAAYWRFQHGFILGLKQSCQPKSKQASAHLMGKGKTTTHQGITMTKGRIIKSLDMHTHFTFSASAQCFSMYRIN